MDADAATLVAVAAGRTAIVAELRALATRLEGLSLDIAAEVLIALEHPVDELRRAARLALERAPTGN